MAQQIPGKPLSRPGKNDDLRWRALLAQVDTAKLTELFLERITGVTGYEPLPVPIYEIRRSALLTFTALLERLDSNGYPNTISIAEEIGVSRARAGVPLASLIEAIRQDFAILWESLIEVALPSDAGLIVRHTGIVLGVVDAFASQTQSAYTAEVQRMRDEKASVQQGLVASLLRGEPSSPEHIIRFSKGLGLPLSGKYTVFAATGEDISPLRRSSSSLEQAGLTAFTHHLDDAFILFRQNADVTGARFETAIDELQSLRAGVAEARGLAEIPNAVQVARSLASTLTPEDASVITWAQGWARLAAKHFRDSKMSLLNDVRSALETCGPVEQRRLEEAVRSYLKTGSIADSAAELFCHRNTLTNRLRRFAAVTGVNPAIPEQAARLVVGWA